ncbi:hypothetical protein NDU88_003155 [Pleurodeles waltl]|uniref:Uncharacterized protein n=1 Tax=Pleurodeles waltl TaxID=8319 RepID=A0AAV7KXD7_PLEWA|nr:hypothetical protein NDU88_003155 [Pleurodeles waltl]
MDLSPRLDTLRLRHLDFLRVEYRELAQEGMKKQMLVMFHRLYDEGDKAGRLLAWLSKKAEKERGRTKAKNRIRERDHVYQVVPEISREE